MKVVSEAAKGKLKGQQGNKETKVQKCGKEKTLKGKRYTLDKSLRDTYLCGCKLSSLTTGERGNTPLA